MRKNRIFKTVFLVVEAMHSTGSSVALCINEIKKNFKDAIILYVSVFKIIDGNRREGSYRL